MTIAFQIIGPTGVGKSYWGEKLVQFLNSSEEERFIFKDLDSEIPNLLETFKKQGPEIFLKLSLEALARLHEKKELYIVATGSGTQWSACYLNVIGRIIDDYPTCTLWATPEWTLQNLRYYRKDPRSLFTLVKTEYTLQHQHMYSAVRCIDRTKLSSEEILLCLWEIYETFKYSL